jgi:endonuclease YncB( thermonuclease family)
MDWPRYSQGRYAEPQEEAREREQGMWAGSFVEPVAVS